MPSTVWSYACRTDLVRWATGCGHAGEIRPFGGRAKLPFNVDWAAKWSAFGVTIEPNGKDLGTRGGARDRSEAIAREVFDREPPLNLVYEFLNVGGRKMSTSKGTGAAATEIAEVVPPEQLRLLFLRPRPNQAIAFDPDGTDAIPRLFDEFGPPRGGDGRPRGPRRAAAGRGTPLRRVPGRPGGRPGGRGGAFRIAVRASRPPRPGARRRRRRDGRPREGQRARAERRRTSSTSASSRPGRGWRRMPPTAAASSCRTISRPPPPTSDGADRAFLAGLAERLDAATTWSGEAIQDAVFEAARASELAPGTAFAALYRRLPRSPQRPARGVAAGHPRARLRPRSAPCRGAAPGTLA